LDYPSATYKVIELLSRFLLKIANNRGPFPNDESALKLLYLALKNTANKRTMQIREWE
jgi:transposase-like protein